MRSLLLILVILTGSVFGQDYGPKATDKESATRMHFAIRLLRGSYSKEQETFLLKAISNRRSISEEEAARLFTKGDLRDIFFGIGREDISTFKTMYEKGRVADKRTVWQTLSQDDRIDARRVNFAWGIGYLNLNEVQVDFLLRFSKAMPGITREDGDLFQAEAIGLFSLETGRLLFSSIGPYTDKPCEKSDTQSLQGSCRCSVGSSFNMSCDGECVAGGTSCTTTGDGCGFAWLYSCNGKCQAS